MYKVETEITFPHDHGIYNVVKDDVWYASFAYKEEADAFAALKNHEIDLKIAEELAMETDYACFAVEEDGNEINKADAGAFFLEGYNYAKGNLR